LGSYNAIEVFGSYELEVSSQHLPSFQISGDDNILPLIITEVRNNILYIRVTNNVGISPRIKLKIRTSSDRIEKISTDGVNSLKVFQIGDRTFNLKQLGTGKTEIFGQTNNLAIDINGTVTVNSQNLFSQQASVKLLGTATVNVHAYEQLSVQILGVGTVNYYGNPSQINKQILGIGSLNKR
ncbi:MAG: GIN domain-containing protein, partial [Xenococcaceae cyanobacterium]